MTQPKREQSDQLDATLNLMEKYPDIVFDSNNLATITTHNNNTYTVVKIPDATYISAMSKASNNDMVIAYTTLVSASLVDPKLSIAEVKNNLYDGDLTFLSMTLMKYYNSKISFL